MQLKWTVGKIIGRVDFWKPILGGSRWLLRSHVHLPWGEGRDQLCTCTQTTSSAVWCPNLEVQGWEKEQSWDAEPVGLSLQLHAFLS